MVTKLFESVLRADTCPVVLCDMAHTVVYMNPAAVKEYGELTGTSILNCHNAQSNAKIKEVVAWFGQSPQHNRVHTVYNPKKNKDVYMVALRDSEGVLLGYYEKHEFRAKDETPFYEL